MASRDSDPKLLFSFSGVSAYHIADGKEESLTPAGPQTLSLLMVPTTSSFAEPTGLEGEEKDYYLHLHLPPELDLPIPATTQIYFQEPTSYLIQRWDLGPDSGAFTRLEFPPVTSKEIEDSIDTFEAILAWCTAFLERARPPVTAEKAPAYPADVKVPPPPPTSRSRPSASKAAASSEKVPAYNPNDYKPGEGYARGSHSSHAGGRLVLVNEEDGSVIGELGEGYDVEESAVKPGSKRPVEITLPIDGKSNTLGIAPASEETLRMELHPAFKKSTMVNKATSASRLIMTTSDAINAAMASGSDNFTRSTQPVAQAVTFKPATHERMRKIGKFTQGAAGLSATTVGQVSKVAQNLGATIAGRGDRNKAGKKGYGPDGRPLDDFKPSTLNKALMAYSTVADGIDQAARNLMTTASTSATTMVTHRWGDEAGDVARELGGGVKNVGLVYIDVTGVSRKAIVKAVGKGMVIGKVKGGGEIIVGDDSLRRDGQPGGSSRPGPGSRTGSTTTLVADDAASMKTGKY